MIGALLSVIYLLLDLYAWIIIIAVVMTWLVNFDVINLHNQFARSIYYTLYALTEPVFRQIRRVVPAIGNLDLSPLIAYFLIVFLKIWISRTLSGQPLF
ncbi:MAG: hypothetical protein RJB62_1651 [Pseudomonadota bacterium]|jgi:YggT family protein